MDKVSYALGMSIGHQLQQMNATDLNISDFAQAITDVFNGDAKLTDADAQAAVQDFFNRKAEEQAKAAKAEGENFLAENAKKEGVKTLPSGQILLCTFRMSHKTVDTSVSVIRIDPFESFPALIHLIHCLMPLIQM